MRVPLTFDKAYRRHLHSRIDELEKALKALVLETANIWHPEGVDPEALKAEVTRAQNVLARTARIFRTGEV